MGKKYFIMMQSRFFAFIVGLSIFTFEATANDNQSIRLSAGWNLVSIYVEPINTNIAEVFSCADIVKNDDGFYKTSQPAFLNSISKIIPGYGYLVHTNSVCNIEIEGPIVKLSSQELKKGWNIIGYPYYETKDVETALNSIIDKVETVKDFEGFWSSNSSINSLTDMIPGQAYYINVAEDCTLKWDMETPPVTTNFTETVNGVAFDMIFVEGGTYQRGCENCATQDKQYEAPIHSVTLNDFHIGKYEITNAQWKAVMGGDLPWGSSENSPKIGVSWFDANKFICKLDSITGKTFRLLTDAEWEFAARGGNKGKNNNYLYSGSNNANDVAWYSTNSSNKAQNVGTKAPNELGIYDMSGNAWEWVFDWLMPYTTDAKTNPVQLTGAGNKTRRGGSYDEPVDFARVSRRAIRSRDGAAGMGFRIAHSSNLLQGMQTPCEAANPTAASCSGEKNRDCRLITNDDKVWSAEIGTGFYANLIITQTGAALTLSANGFAFTQLSGEWYSLNNRSLNLVSTTGAKTTQTFAYYVFSETEMSMIGDDGLPLRFYKKLKTEAGGTMPGVPNITNPTSLTQLLSSVPSARMVTDEQVANPDKTTRDSRLVPADGKTWFMDGRCCGGNHKYRFHLSANGDAEFVVMDYDNTLKENILAKGKWFTVGNVALHIELDGKYYNYLYTVGNRTDARDYMPAGPIFTHLSFQSYERGDMRTFSTLDFDSNVKRDRGPSGENPVYPAGDYQINSGGN